MPITDPVLRALHALTALALAIASAHAAEGPSGLPPASAPAARPPDPAATVANEIAAADPTAPAMPANAVHWDYLPRVGYLGDGLWFSLRVPHGTAPRWRASAGSHELATTIGNGGDTVDLHLPLSGAIPGTVAFIRADAGISRTVRLVQPGGGNGLSFDSENGRLISGGDAAVLVVDRTEADTDRRWSQLRHLGGHDTLRCGISIDPPVVRTGDSALLAGIAQDQAVPVRGQNVLLMVPGADCLASWKHREFRQALAWMVSDLHCRGAGHVVLAPPLLPPLEGGLAVPLTDEMADVARAYHCRTVDLTGMQDERYWLLAPGVEGPTLNAGGRARLQELLAPWR